jgi:hypothetical protein
MCRSRNPTIQVCGHEVDYQRHVMDFAVSVAVQMGRLGKLLVVVSLGGT